MFDPAGRREDLIVFELMSADLPARMVEDHESGTRRALIDGPDKAGLSRLVHHSDSVMRRVCLAWSL
jgi:hypothetical protein